MNAIDRVAAQNSGPSVNGNFQFTAGNSAKTIEDIMVQYRALMNVLGIPHTDQDVADITAYMKLL